MKKNKLLEIRKEKGLSQKEVAEKAKICIRNYQNYEYGKALPKVEIALKLAEILEKSVEEIFKEE